MVERGRRAARTRGERIAGGSLSSASGADRLFTFRFYKRRCIRTVISRKIAGKSSTSFYYYIRGLNLEIVNRDFVTEQGLIVIRPHCVL